MGKRQSKRWQRLQAVTDQRPHKPGQICVNLRNLWIVELQAQTWLIDVTNHQGAKTMNSKEFRCHAHELVDWMADYLETVEQQPVKARVSPGEIADQLPAGGPEEGEAMDAILADFRETILPG